jgi:predicted transcriptional regulator
MPTLTAQVTDDFAAEMELERWRQTEQAIEMAENGEVVPAEEVFAWLDTWGQEGTATK